jgi:hypothetical protein
MRFYLYLVILIIPLIGCDSTEGDGAGGLEPTQRYPEIQEGMICGDVIDGKPAYIDNTYFRDERIHVWLRWENFLGSHEVNVIWVEPDGDIARETRSRFRSDSGEQVTFFYLDTTHTAPLGPWLAEIYIDGRFARSYVFWIAE